MTANDDSQHESDFGDAFERMDKDIKELVDPVFGDYSKFISALHEDVQEASKRMRAEDCAFTRRSFLRALFAFIEGALFARRTIVLELNRPTAGGYVVSNLADGDRMLLREITFEHNDNGTVKERNGNFQVFLKYLRFTFDIYFRSIQRPNPVDYRVAGWESFCKAHEIRNRITHPKRVLDLSISDDELQHIRLPERWFIGQFNKR